MRRKEFAVQDRALVEQVLKEARVAHVSMVDGGGPYGVPVNCAWTGTGLVFHGARSGRKWAALAMNPQVHVCVYREYSYIPTWFIPGNDGCQATQFFASVMMEGRVRVVDDPAEEARLLALLLDAFQPGIPAPGYPEAVLAATAVFVVEPESMEAKFKFGQQFSDEKRAAVRAGLVERGAYPDLETVDMMDRARKVRDGRA